MDTLNRYEANASDIALPQDPIEVLRIAWQRKHLIILSLALCVGAGGAYWYWAPRIYESKAQVLVIKTTDGSVSPGDESQGLKLSYFQDYLSAHETLMKSPLLVGRAIEEHGLDQLTHIVNNPKYRKNPTSAIIKNLNAARDFSGEVEDASAVLDLAYRSTDPDECEIVLRAIIETYNKYLEENDQSGTEKIRGLVSQWNDEIQVKLDDKKARYVELRDTTSDLVSKGSGGFAVSQTRLETIATERLPHTVRKQQIQYQLEALQSAKDSGVNHEVLMGMVSRWYVSDAKPDHFHRIELLKAMVQEQALRRQYGPGHPLVEAVHERINLIQNMNAGSSDGIRPTEFVDPVESFMESLRRELDVTRGIEESLTELFEEEHKKAQVANATSTDLDDLRTEIADLQLLQKTVIQQVQSLDFADNSGLYDSQVIGIPERGIKVAPSSILILAIAIVCGIVMGASVVFLAEIVDQSFRTTDEIHRKLYLPVIGNSPRLKRLRRARVNGKRSSVHPIIHAHYRPNSRQADAFRSIRIAMYASMRKAAYKVVQVTSPLAGDGASTLAANLAVSVAQSGKKVLLIDANLRKPTLHRLFKHSNQTGLSSVLSEERSLGDAVGVTEVPGLWLLPSGPRPQNAAEALSSVRFSQCMDALRERFDLVIIDTPAVLTVTDPCIVADGTDKVILVLKNSRQSRQQAEQAMNLLAMTGADFLGIVMNARGKRGAFRGSGVAYGFAQHHAVPNRNGESIEAPRPTRHARPTPTSPDPDLALTIQR